MILSAFLALSAYGASAKVQQEGLKASLALNDLVTELKWIEELESLEFEKMLELVALTEEMYEIADSMDEISSYDLEAINAAKEYINKKAEFYQKFANELNSYIDKRHKWYQNQ